MTMADEDTAFEMSTSDRPTRFHVNKVEKRNSITASQHQQHPDEKSSMKHFYDLSDNDTFSDETSNIINTTRQTRIQSLRKSSFRDKDKPSRLKDLQASARFQVSSDKEDSDSNDEDRGPLLDSEYDTKYGRSFRHFTREALPRLDNYRNILSIQAAYRPTLDELHNATLTNKLQDTLQRNSDAEVGVGKGQFKFGWIQGVLMRCLLNIWGVMLFLRLSWVVGQAGIGEAIVLILTTTAVTAITAVSMSAISTNGVIKGGGTYYMISRSLGPEFGGSIGLIFSLANAVACAMYVVGFCESLQDLLTSLDAKIVDGGIQDVRIIGSITIVILTCIVVIGMEWEAKAQIGLLIILLIAIGDFLIGAMIGPKSDLEKTKGYLGFNMALLQENFVADYREHNKVHHDFFSVLAIFFPAATGILAGANISGDLRDPQKAIPKGTILAIFITTLSYILMAILAGATVLRQASGNITDIVNGTLFVSCEIGECAYGLHNSFQVIELVSAFGPLIYAGCFAATLSSALASLVSAPKVFQALCKDELYPKIKWFAKGYGKNNEPVRGYVLTFFISIAFILVGRLNLIAPLISNFFLAAYALINFSTFHASLIKPVGWRPTFRYYNMWLSLIGAVLCVSVMFLISWATALLTFAVIVALYLIVSYRKPDVNWGSSTQAQTYKKALMTVQQLNSVEEHVKNFRPQILVLSGHPNSRPMLIDFAYLITKNVSLLLCGNVVKTQVTQKYRNYLQRRANDWFKKHKIRGFYSEVDDENFEFGCRALMQASGIGKLKPNIVMMGYKSDWNVCDKAELDQYFHVMHKALDMHLAVAILRVPKRLDYSQVLGDDRSIIDMPLTIQPNDSTIDLHKHAIHGSCDSLSRNVSQAGYLNVQNDIKNNIKSSSLSDLSMPTTPIARNTEVSGLPDPLNKKNNLYLHDGIKKSKKSHDPTMLYKGPGGTELPKDILNELTMFTSKRKNAVIDVWWLYDDGGLTLLLPYIISTRRNWNSCKLRVFALANKQDELEFEQRSMASLLSKFRIDYSDLQLLPDITKKAQESTVEYFENIIKDFVDNTNSENPEKGCITKADLIAVQDKTNRYLRLREYLMKNSSKSDLIVMTLPVPRKNIISAPLYMAWLESLSRDLPPFLFVRGNQTSVLTFYS